MFAAVKYNSLAFTDLKPSKWASHPKNISLHSLDMANKKFFSLCRAPTASKIFPNTFSTGAFFWCLSAACFTKAKLLENKTLYGISNYFISNAICYPNITNSNPYPFVTYYSLVNKIFQYFCDGFVRVGINTSDFSTFDRWKFFRMTVENGTIQQLTRLKCVECKATLSTIFRRYKPYKPYNR